MDSVSSISLTISVSTTKDYIRSVVLKKKKKKRTHTHKKKTHKKNKNMHTVTHASPSGVFIDQKVEEVDDFTDIGSCMNSLFFKVSWCFEPSRLRRITSGLKQTSVYLKVIHSTSHYTTSLFLSNHNSHSIHNSQINEKQKQTITHVLEPIYTPRALNTEPPFSRVTYFILRVCTGTGVSHS